MSRSCARPAHKRACRTVPSISQVGPTCRARNARPPHARGVGTARVARKRGAEAGAGADGGGEAGRQGAPSTGSGEGGDGHGAGRAGRGLLGTLGHSPARTATRQGASLLAQPRPPSTPPPRAPPPRAVCRSRPARAARGCCVAPLARHPQLGKRGWGGGGGGTLRNSSTSPCSRGTDAASSRPQAKARRTPTATCVRSGPHRPRQRARRHGKCTHKPHTGHHHTGKHAELEPRGGARALPPRLTLPYGRHLGHQLLPVPDTLARLGPALATPGAPPVVPAQLFCVPASPQSLQRDEAQAAHSRAAG